MNPSTFKEQTTVAWSGRIYSDGWQQAHGGKQDVRSAATGEVLASSGSADRQDVDNAVRSAHAAQAAWANMPFDRRAAVIRQAATLLEQRAAEFNHWNVRECGSIGPKAQWEHHATVEQLWMAAALPMQANGLQFPSSLPGRENTWRRVPVGVVGVISPWNFPLLLGMRSVAPALALGNAVVYKPDSQAAITGGLLLAQLFEDAGLPPGVLHVIPGGAEAGDALVRHPMTDMVSFTGSTAVGRSIAEICGRALKKVVLELGGNNAMIVLSDADLDGASSCAAWGAFLHQGQICMQAGRHLVHRSVAEAYAEKLRVRAEALVVGDPAQGSVHLGPLINDRQTAKVHDIVQSSIQAGARALTGASHEGRFYRPTVLADVTSDMPAFQQEIFGPVAPITVFDTDEEAVELANASEYGLAAAIHSLDLARATALAARLKTGMVHINDQPVNNEFQVPFGGMGSSSWGGRFGGPANLETFTTTQWVSTLARPLGYPF
jgi:benzaldehyde dehydrogenase (NAD)